MKKLQMDLNGIGELLNKEQMKMVTGGTDYNLYITCVLTPDGSGLPAGQITRGYYHTSYVAECATFCTMASWLDPYTNTQYYGNGSCGFQILT